MKPFYASKTPKELRDCWGTPQWLFDRLSLEFDFAIDAAADEHNKKCPLYFKQGLGFNWADFCPEGKWVWNNPPFSLVDPWVDQWIQCAESGRGVVSIVNAQTSSRWFHKALEACSEARFSIGRVAFIHPATGKRVAGNNLGQVLFVFEPGKLGEKRIGTFKGTK